MTKVDMGIRDFVEPEEKPARVCILEEAAELTSNDRNKTYGEPVANMQHIANIFNAITGLTLTARQIAQVHIATKLARTETSPLHFDSYVDTTAYRGIEYECALEENRNEAVERPLHETD
jgi:hypothetical protein